LETTKGRIRQYALLVALIASRGRRRGGVRGHSGERDFNNIGAARAAAISLQEIDRCPCRRLVCSNAGATSASMIHHGSEDRMTVVAALVKRLVVRDDGQDLLEYGLLVTLIALVAIAAIGTVGSTINTVLWQPIANNF